MYKRVNAQELIFFNNTCQYQMISLHLSCNLTPPYLKYFIHIDQPTLLDLFLKGNHTNTSSKDLITELTGNMLERKIYEQEILRLYIRFIFRGF